MLWQKIFLTKRPKRESTEFLGYKMLYNCTYFLERFNVDAKVGQMFVEVRIYITWYCTYLLESFNVDAKVSQMFVEVRI